MMHHFSSLFFLFLSLNFLTFTISTTSPSDIATLQALKSFIIPSSIPPWSCLASWNFSSDPCNPSNPTHFVCGLSCTTSADSVARVYTISLDPVRYTGSLEHLNLSGLTSLAVLNLANNAFYGPLPNSLSTLSNLETLILSSNAFTGTLTRSISGLVSLETLDLSRNALTGTIPESLRFLTKLRMLDLSSNRLYGFLPRHLPPNLVELAIRGNLLSGTLRKSSFLPLKNLQVLELGSNCFVGTLEGWLFQLPSLQQVNLGNNSIQSLQISSPTETNELVALDIGYNNISGSLPVEFANYETLVALTMSHNRLTGSIPWQYISAKKGLAFRRLFLDGNFLNGKVPDGFFTGGESEVSGSFGDNCLLNCPTTIQLCAPAQKPLSVCKQIYGTEVMVDFN